MRRQCTCAVRDAHSFDFTPGLTVQGGPGKLDSNCPVHAVSSKVQRNCDGDCLHSKKCESDYQECLEE